jgi:hypothetical protein
MLPAQATPKTRNTQSLQKVSHSFYESCAASLFFRWLPRGKVLAVHGQLYGIRGRLWALGLWLHAVWEALGFWWGWRPPSPRLRPQDRKAWNAIKQGKALFLTYHFHRFEWLGAELVRLGIPLLAAAKPFAQAKFGSAIKAKRQRYGIPTVESEVPRQALRHLRQGGCFAFLWDQRPSPRVTPNLEWGFSNSPETFHQNPSATLAGIPVAMNPLPTALMRLAQPLPVFAGVWLPQGEICLWQLCTGKEAHIAEKAARRYHRIALALARQYPSYHFGLLHQRFKGYLY